jgi:Tfp pilus assembly pilus retraction ATPase PilT
MSNFYQESFAIIIENMEKKKSIGDLLIELGKISQEDLEEGIRLQKVFNLRLGETLVKLGKIAMADIEWILSKQLDIHFVNVAIANLIREGKTFQIPSMIQMGKADEMQLLDQAIMELLMQKIVSPEEAFHKANDKKPFERFLNKA